MRECRTGACVGTGATMLGGRGGGGMTVASVVQDEEGGPKI